MKKAALYVSVASLFLTFVSFILIGVTYGWFLVTKSIPEIDISSGDLHYVIGGDFIANNTVIVPGQELLVSPLTIENLSSVDTQMRVRIEYQAYVRVGETVTPTVLTYQDSLTDHLIVDFASGYVHSGGYWYYTVSPTPATDYVFLAESGVLGMIDSITYDGWFTGSDYFAEAVFVHVYIQVKQADGVTWVDLATYDFATGNPI